MHRSIAVVSLLVCSIVALPSIPRAHATGPIFTVAMSQWLGYGNSVVNQNTGGLTSAGGDIYGDGYGMVSSGHAFNALYQLLYFKSFVYNPTAYTDLHLYIKYHVSVYVACTAGGAGLLAQVGVAAGAISSFNGSPNWVLPMATFENDQVGCPISGNANNAAKNSDVTVDEDLNTCLPPQNCYVIGNTYTFVLLFQVSADVGSYIVHADWTQSGTLVAGTTAAYLDAGFNGSSGTDFTNGNYCTILSYQSSPVFGCPAPSSGGGGSGGGGGGPPHPT